MIGGSGPFPLAKTKPQRIKRAMSRLHSQSALPKNPYFRREKCNFQALWVKCDSACRHVSKQYSPLLGVFTPCQLHRLCLRSRQKFLSDELSNSELAPVWHRHKKNVEVVNPEKTKDLWLFVQRKGASNFECSVWEKMTTLLFSRIPRAPKS